MRYAIIIGVLLIATPLLLRLHSQEQYPDAESYDQLRTATINATDPLTSAAYTHTPADYIYKYVPSQLVLIVCAALTLLLMSVLLDDEFFLLLFAASPIFIKTFTTAGPAAPAFVLISLSAYLVRKRQYWSVIIVPLCFSFSFSLGVLATIMLILVAISADLPFIALGASFFALISATVTSIIHHSLSIGFVTPSWTDYLGISAASHGVTIFLVFLGLLGFLLQLAEQPRPVHFITLIIVPFAMFFDHGLIILAAVLAFYGAQALRFLASRTWHFEELRSITLLLIACGLLFSAIVAERERLHVNQDRIELVRFVTAAYPKGTAIAAQDAIAPLLRYNGYPSGWPQNTPYVLTASQNQGYAAIVADSTDQQFSDLQPAYAGAYAVYNLQ